jgi:hypothetical protein
MLQWKGRQIQASVREVDEHGADYLDEVPTEYGDTEPVSNEEDYSIAVEFPGEEEIKLMRIPKGNEWAFFETFINVKLGENEWIAGFDDGISAVPWDASDRAPRPGQRVRVFWIKEKVKKEKEAIREERVKDVTQVVFSKPKPASAAHTVREGGTAVPMETIHKKGQQPLSLKSEQQRRFVEEERRQRSERFKKAKLELSEIMDCKELKRMIWVKLARKKGIPYFEEPLILEAWPTESIENTPPQLLHLPNKPIRTEDRRSMLPIGARWKDSFHWDMVSKEVELVSADMMDPGARYIPDTNSLAQTGCLGITRR